MKPAGRRWAGAATAALAPWMWFAVRNLGPLFDVVATGLPVILGLSAVALAAVAVLRRQRHLLLATVSCLIAGAVAVAGPWRAQTTPPPISSFRIVAANLRAGNPSVDKGVADVLARHGDLVLLIEASRGKWTPPAEYPTVIRPQESNQVVLSRYPARLLDRPAGWPPRLRAHRLEVDAPSGRVVVYLVHLVRPHLGPRRIFRAGSQLGAQRREREALMASARAETAPVVLAGDFNTSDRSRGYRQLAGRFRDAARSDFGGPTYVAPLWRPLLLRIDHVFVPRSWCSRHTRRFGIHGSDHRGVAVDVGPCLLL